MGKVTLYFRFCEACNVFEYDCFGVDAKCIAIQPGYRNAHQRAADRRKQRHA